MPVALLFSTDQTIPKTDPHYTLLPVRSPQSFAALSTLWQTHQPVAVYTHGTVDPRTWAALSVTYQVRRRWVHFDELPTHIDVAATAFSASLQPPDTPLLSVITSTYNSGAKILRPFRSLQAQTYTHWNWIIWDDSPTPATYETLLDLESRDLRIQVYRAPRPSGSIGAMKRRAAGLATGDFIVEVDHDDELHPALFQWIVDAAAAHPAAQFFYTDAAELHEGTLAPVSYGDFFGFGYGMHENVWSETHGRYVTAAITPQPNPTTLRHLVGLPNHVRVWRTPFYDAIGKHNPTLTVADDYDLLLRSWFSGAIWCHIRACGYYQYRNADGNFTAIRNGLIQHTVTEIASRAPLPPTDPRAGRRPIWADDGGWDYPRSDRVVTWIPATDAIWADATILVDPTEADLRAADGPVIAINPPTLTLPAAACRRLRWWTLRDATSTEKERYATIMAQAFTRTMSKEGLTDSTH